MEHDRVIFLPVKLQRALAETGISKVSIAFEIFSAPDGSIGESWLLLAAKNGLKRDIFVFSAPPMEELKIVKQIPIEEIKKTTVETTFLGNLKIVFKNSKEEEIFSLEIPALQRSSWDALLEDLEKELKLEIERIEIDSGFSKMESVASEVVFPGIDSLKVGESLEETMEKLGAMQSQVSQSSVFSTSVQQVKEDNISIFVQEQSPLFPDGSMVKTLSELSSAPAVLKTAPLPQPPKENKKQEKLIKEAKGKKCKKCGMTNKEGYVYCISCGAPTGGSRMGKILQVRIQGSGTGDVEIQDEGGSCLSKIFYFILLFFAFSFLLSFLFAH